MRIPFWTSYWEGVRELIGDVREYIQYRRDQKPDPRPPIMLTDDILGTFRYDRRTCWFITQRDWNGAAVALTLHGEWKAEAPDMAEAQAAAFAARCLWEDESGWLKQMQEVAVRDLLELAGEWQADDGPLGEGAFLSRMRICAISIFADGGFTADFDDGDMFNGHTIEVWGDLRAGAESAGIAG